jgi:hypothetical protein
MSVFDFRQAQRAPMHGHGPRCDPRPSLWARAARQNKSAQSRVRKIASNRASCAHFLAYEYGAHISIGLSVPALVLTFDSQEKVLDRIVAGSVPGLFGLAQVGSSGPPAQLSRDLPG